MNIFFKIVVMSLFFSLLSLALFVTGFALYGFAPAYIVYIFIIILGISFFAAGSVIEPIEELKDGFQRIIRGEAAKVRINTGDEFEELANAFNVMAEELLAQRERLKRSEEKYRNLVENINDWVFELNENYVFTYSSPRSKSVVGYEPEELMGQSILKLVDDPENVVRNLSNLRYSDSVRFESEVRRKDGGVVYLEVNVTPFRDGFTMGYRCVGRDVTDRKKADQEVAYFRSVLEHSVDAIVILDLDSRVVSWNKGAEMMFGYTAEEMIGRPLNSIMPEDRWDECRENFKKAVLRGYVRDIETVRIAKDGRTVIVDQTLTSIFNSEGELVGFVAIMRDITKKKEAERKLKEAYRELEVKTEELLRSKKELEYLANILENSNDAIYSVNLDGIITSWNKTAEKLFGWKKTEAIGMKAEILLPDELKKEVEFTIRKIKDGVESMRYETKRVRADGRIIDVEVTISPIEEFGEIEGFSVIARDISWKLKAEREIMRKVLKYEVEKGRVYLVEKDFELAKDVVRDLVKCGFRGIVISRKYPEDLCLDNCTHFWLSDKRNADALPADVDRVYDAIMMHPEWNVAVLIDLDYLIVRNDFEDVFNFVQKLRDAFYFLKKGVVLFVVDPVLLSEREIAMLKKECGNLTAKHMDIPEDAFEVLRYVYMKNRVGVRPSIKDIMKEFNVTRNTAKKRISYLDNKGLIRIIKNGRLRVMEVTDSGREIFA